jgi:hypothetical protein
MPPERPAMTYVTRNLLVADSKQAGVFGAANGFKAGMGVEFAKDVLDVVIDCGSADVKLLGDCGGRHALCEQPEHLQFALRQFSLAGRRASGRDQRGRLLRGQPRPANHEIAYQHLETLAKVDLPNDVYRVGYGRAGFLGYQYRDIAPLPAVSRLDLYIEVPDRVVFPNGLLNAAVRGANWSTLIHTAHNVPAHLADRVAGAHPEHRFSRTVPGHYLTTAVNGERTVGRAVDKLFYLPNPHRSQSDYSFDVI